ncbi:MAG: RNA-binding protein [Candidatus Cloacimonetes bacterium HGW-Cloacimonetes-3]|jgi:spoIIIJ-associated protein|nr:MAG: RNA-binding protein [Candidatus Cloacimonetes bacterium HGW-Cloacimonetes-3]
MTTIDKSGTCIEDIISAFRKENNIQDWELKYEILKKPSNGIFGLFASKTALVRFQLPDTADRAKLYTNSLLTKMGVGFDSITTKLEGKTLYLEIVGCTDTGFLIGKNGNMLESIQFLVNRVFEYDRKIEKIYLDADGYRERREDFFFRQFQPQISKIKAHGKPLTLEPMSAGERRIIHRHVERDKGLRTLTIGEGEKKRIVIFSAKQSEREALSHSNADRGKHTPESSDEKTTQPAAKQKTARPPRPPRAPKTDIPAGTSADYPFKTAAHRKATKEATSETDSPTTDKPAAARPNRQRRRPPKPASSE